MTTCIVTRDGILSDSLISGDTNFSTRKTLRIDGALWTGAGEWECVLQAISYLTGRASDRPEFDDDTTIDVVQLDRAGIRYYSEKLVPIEVTAEPLVIGSGRQYAIGALSAGATLSEAIEIAAAHDNDTRGPFCWEPL